MAVRVSLLTQARRGAVANTRPEALPHSGQAHGSLRVERLRMASKPPQLGQSYS
jgi:hypothetical protein